MNLNRLSTKTKLFSPWLVVCVLFASGAAWAGVMDEVRQVQHDWAMANYQLQNDAQEKAFKQLVERVEQLTESYPESAEGWIWSGIVKSSYAGARGGLGALSLAKQSRKDLEKALELNSEALDGSAYTSLATLYAQVPGWPLGFGDDDKAGELFGKALAVNPKGIDPNYFYAEFLFDEGHYQKAEKYYLMAQQAPARPDRPIADAGRQREIRDGLDETREKLAN